MRRHALHLVGVAVALLLVSCASRTIGGAAPSASIRWALSSYQTQSHLTASNLIIDADGGLWFSLSADQRIVRVTSRGAMTEFATPRAGGHPQWLANGTDGTVWFADDYQIGRVTKSGAVAEFDLPAPHARGTDETQASWLTLGPDNAMWFLESHANKVGRITPAGEITEFPIPSAKEFAALFPGTLAAQPAYRSSLPRALIVGLDDALWFAESATSRVARISTDGNIVEYPLPSSVAPWRLAVRPDRALWVVYYRSLQSDGRTGVGRFLPGSDPQFIESSLTDALFDLGTRADPIVDMQGSLWLGGTLTQRYGGPGAIVTVSMDGAARVTRSPDDATIRSLTVGPDRAIWFLAEGSGRESIGRLAPDGTSTREPVPGRTPQIGSNLVNLVSGNDGALWFLARNGSATLYRYGPG